MELYYDFQKVDCNVIHAFLEELLDVNGFQPGVQILIIEMMSRWKNRLSYVAKKEVGEVRLENGIIQQDSFSSLLFVFMIDPFIKIMKRFGDSNEFLYYMDCLKASMYDVETVQIVHETAMKYDESLWIVVNRKKSAIPLNFKTPLQESRLEMTRMDESMFKYLNLR